MSKGICSWTMDIEPYPDDDPEPYPDDSIEDEIESYSDDNQETCDTQAIKFHEIRKRLSSCPDNCTWRLSRQEFQEISKNRPKSQMDHAQWLLDYFFEHATEENVCHLICGKEVCEKCWREVHKVSPYKYNKYLGESRQGVRGKIHGNTGSIKPSIEHIVFGAFRAVRGEICHAVSDCDIDCVPPHYKICEGGQCYCTSAYFCTTDSDCSQQCAVDPRKPTYRCLQFKCVCYNPRH